MTATTRPDGTSDGDTQATPPPTPPPTTPAADPSAGASGASAPAAESGTYRVRFGMRAKMLTAFTFVFTVIFVIIGLFVVNYVGSQAQSQLVSQLQATAQGGAKTIDGNGMVQLRAQIPQALPGKFPANFPLDNPLYVKLCQQLINITKLVPKAQPYTYFMDPVTKTMEWETTNGIDPPLPYAAIYRQPITGLLGTDSLAGRLMAQGLVRTTNQAPYAEADVAFKFISTYTPIRDSSGKAVAGLGVDYPMQYVGVVRAGAIRGVLPILLLSYILLFLMVLVLATILTRPLKHLTAATARIADGDYDVDLTSIVKTRIPDEMSVLARSFVSMVDKVKIRERNLTQQVKRLTVQIDQKKREESVTALTDSDFFSGIVAKGKVLREAFQESEGAADPTPPV